MNIYSFFLTKQWPPDKLGPQTGLDDTRTMTRTTKTRSSTSEFSPAGMRVVENPLQQEIEEIDALPLPSASEPATSGPVKVRQRTSGDRDFDKHADRRHIDGLKIIENPAALRAIRIRSRSLRVPAADEIGYKKLFTRFEEAFLGQDVASIKVCLSPSFEWRLPNGDVIYGRNQALDEMERRFAMVNGPKFSRSVWRFKGKTVIQTYRVKYLGPDGRWRKSRGLDLYKIRNGLITRKDAYWKMIP